MTPSDRLVVTLGEAMIVFYPERHLPLAVADEFRSDIGGAEFNVATTLARMGLPSAWISRLGNDGFGERIERAAREYGLDVSAIQRDDTRPTGLYVKETTPGENGVATRMHYYRRDSAASAINPQLLRAPAARALLQRASGLHVTGITAALSPTAADAASTLREVVPPGTRISVDLNFRPALWRDRDTSALDALLSQADLLFAGNDEAEAYFGQVEPDRLFAAFPQLGTIVLKEDTHRASVYRRDGRIAHVPSLSVEVIEPVGAGDAFAAGFLAGLAEGCSDDDALRLGHATAALALIAHADRPAVVPGPVERRRIARASDEWATWRVGPGRIPWSEE